MDLMCLCSVSVKAMILGCGWAFIRDCRSIMVVCMPLVFRVRAVMDWYGKGVGCGGFWKARGNGDVFGIIEIGVVVVLAGLRVGCWGSSSVGVPVACAA